VINDENRAISPFAELMDLGNERHAPVNVQKRRLLVDEIQTNVPGETQYYPDSL